MSDLKKAAAAAGAANLERNFEAKAAERAAVQIARAKEVLSAASLAVNLDSILAVAHILAINEAGLRGQTVLPPE